MTTRVAVNGYGVIGQRVADAIRLQPDMELVGVADISSDYRIQAASMAGIPVYSAGHDSSTTMKNDGIRVVGELDELLHEVDVVVDCTPAGVGASNLERYRGFGIKSIVQGGEKHETTGHSFVSHANYESASGRDATRVVSCNTTATVRTLTALKSAGLLNKARGVLLRRATDPWESDHSGIMNTVVPEKSIPSHQGPDAKTVVPDLDVVTMAAKGSHTQGHAHFWTVEMTRPASNDEVLEAFRAMPRLAFVRRSNGLAGLNSLVDLMQSLGRSRGDMYEVALWEDILTVEGNELYFTYAVDNQAIVVPEIIDAIRALTSETPRVESMRLTDESLGIRQDSLTC